MKTWSELWLKSVSSNGAGRNRRPGCAREPKTTQVYLRRVRIVIADVTAAGVCGRQMVLMLGVAIELPFVVRLIHPNATSGLFGPCDPGHAGGPAK